MATVIRTPKDYRTNAAPWWCPGCGDFGVLRALQEAAAKLNLAPENVVLVAGIGCSGKIGDYFRSYSVHTVHGRTMPVATGIKLANRNLTVIAAGGDGDGYGIGLNHFIHAVRRNIDITYIVMDNHIYGLTKGQFSPTSAQGFKTTSSPAGTADRPVKPLQLALAAGVTYLAQAFSSYPDHMAEIIAEAIQHKGFSLVNCISPCVTYNKVNTYDFYKENLVNLDEDPDYDPRNYDLAVETVRKYDELVIGRIYINDSQPSYQDLLPGYAEEPLVQARLEYEPEHWQEILKEFA